MADQISGQVSSRIPCSWPARPGSGYRAATARHAPPASSTSTNTQSANGPAIACARPVHSPRSSVAVTATDEALASVSSPRAQAAAGAIGAGAPGPADACCCQSPGVFITVLECHVRPVMSALPPESSALPGGREPKRPPYPGVQKAQAPWAGDPSLTVIPHGG